MPHPGRPDSDPYAYYNTAYELGADLARRRLTEFANDPDSVFDNPGTEKNKAKPVADRHIGLLGGPRGKKGFEGSWRRLESGQDELFSTGMTYHLFTGYWEVLISSSLHVGAAHELGQELKAFLQVVSNARLSTMTVRSEETYFGEKELPEPSDPDPVEPEVTQHTTKRSGPKQESMAAFHIFRDKETLKHIQSMFQAGGTVENVIHSMTARAIETTLNAVARPTSTFSPGAVPQAYLDTGEAERNLAKNQRNGLVRHVNPNYKRRHSVGSQAFDAEYLETLMQYNKKGDVTPGVKRIHAGDRSRSVSPVREPRGAKKKQKPLSQSQGAVGTGNSGP
ncbi:hypothetical protein [uncultured Tateyamaria sp.]|uniref:hypothetical protein n=1 Tax=Tateyamaria sp. 1078 TaxID=3417464 RepID=UPI00262F6D99|nr:hypothetical protein [uncultured Tateyamaria sp.]